jgi:hypothetical protein
MLPLSRSQFGNAIGGMLADPLQHIDQVGVGIDAVESQVTIKLCITPTCLAPSVDISNFCPAPSTCGQIAYKPSLRVS